MTENQMQSWRDAMRAVARKCGVPRIGFSHGAAAPLGAVFHFGSGSLHIQAQSGTDIEILPCDPRISITRMIALIEEICAAHLRWDAPCP